MRRFRVLLVLLALAVIVPTKVSTRRTIFNLANCNQSTLASAVSSAVDGDTINLPTCAVNWSSGIFVNKSITIQGAGMTSTVITSTEVPVGGVLQPMIDWNTKSTGNTPAGFTKLANLTLNGGSGGEGGNQVPMLRLSGNSGRVVILGVHIVQTRQEGFRATGYVRGVYANGALTHNGFFGVSMRVEHENWGDHSGVGGTGCGGCGDKSWSEPSSLGTDQAFVFENNVFIDNTGLAGLAFLGDGWSGLRVVWRFNEIRNTQTGNHGLDSGGRFRSARQWEYYRNTIINDVFVDGVFGTRGGTGLVFDNTVSVTGGGGANKIFSMSSYRNNPAPTGGVRASYWPWSRCSILPVSSITRSGTTATLTTDGGDGTGHWRCARSGLSCDGAVFAQSSRPWIEVRGASDSLYNGVFQVDDTPTSTTITYTMPGTPAANASGTLTLRSPFDQNAEASGYRCMDQVGSGQQSTMISGVNPTPGSFTEALEPVYIFNNIYNGSLQSASVVHGSGATVENREYYNQATSFNGTVGVGRGVIASRPATCTTGVSYWATNEGEWDSTNGATPDGRLYKCTATNTWTLFYTPLAYPHPLLSGAVPESPVVIITSPTSGDHYDTLTSSVTITGTATDDVSVNSVSYSSDRGPSGSCSFASPPNFSCSSISLSSGVNVITGTATDGTLQGTDILNVLFLAANIDESDNFDRANWPTLGPWWTQLGTSSPYAIASNFAVGVGSNFDCAAWNQFSFNDDQFSEATIGFVADTTNAVRVAVRISGSGASHNSYFLSTDGLSGSGHTFIGKFIGGSLEVLQDIATTFTAGDVMSLEVAGSNLKAFKNDVQIGIDQATGGQLTSGSAGLCFYGAASSLNNWSGGNLEEGPPDPPLGTGIVRFRRGGG